MPIEKMRIKNLEEGKIRGCLTGEGPVHIQVMMEGSTAEIIREIAIAGPKPKDGEHLSTYFMITRLVFDGNPRKVGIAGYFVKNYRGDAVSKELSSRIFSGYYDFGDELGEMNEVETR